MTSTSPIPAVAPGAELVRDCASAATETFRTVLTMGSGYDEVKTNASELVVTL